MNTFAEVRRRVRNAALRAYEVCVFTALLVGALELLPGIVATMEADAEGVETPSAPTAPQCGNSQSSPAVITR